jgi:PhzF family phenazine biosynthesis protein
MQMQRRFHQVDVFASYGFSGNPVAVVHDAEGLETDEMLRITSWTNLSEVTFLLPPTTGEADYRVRIFCPGRELPFAGHPTLGTCRAWLAAGGTPKHPDRVVQECGAGLIPVRCEQDRLAFAAPPLTRSGPVEPQVLADRLDQLGLRDDDIVDSAWVDNGPGWMAVLLPSVESVLAVDIPGDVIPGFDVGLVAAYPPGGECALELRALFADAGGRIREDPVTGSLNAAVAQWLLAAGRLEAPYVASQGTALGRRGRIHVSESDGEIWVGGDTFVSIEGTIDC